MTAPNSTPGSAPNSAPTTSAPANAGNPAPSAPAQSSGKGSPAPTTATGTPAPQSGAQKPAQGDPSRSTGNTSTDAKPGETPSEQAKRILKLKREGKIEEVDAETALSLLMEDLSEDGVINTTQIASAAREKMRRAAQLEKELKAAAADLTDPDRAMRLLEKKWGGRDKMRELIEDWYHRDMEERAMTPEQRKHRQLKAELEQYEARKAEIQKQEQEKRAAALAQEHQRKIGAAFSEALKLEGVENSPYLMQRMAARAQADLNDGIPINPKAIAAEVVREYQQGEVASHVRQLAKDPSRLRQAIGEEAFRALLKHEVERVKQKQKAPAAPAQRPAGGSGGSTSRNGQREAVDIDDFFANLKRG